MQFLGRILLGIFILHSFPTRTEALPLSLEDLLDRRIELYDDPRKFRIELEAYLAEVRADEDPELWAMLHVFAGEAAWFQEDFKGTQEHVNAALPFAQKRPLEKAQAMLTYLKGGVLEFEGQFSEAEPYFRDAIRIAKATESPPLIAYILGVTASFYHRHNYNNESAELHREALQIFSQLPQDFIYYDFLSAIGTLYAQSIGPKRAEGYKMLDAVLNFSRQNRLRYLQYWTYESMNTLYNEAKIFEKLDEYLNERLKIAESLGYESYIVGSRLERGRMRYRQGRCPEALNDLEFARSYFRNNRISFYDIAILSELGECYIELKQINKVKPLIEEFSGALKDASSDLEKQKVYTMLRAYYEAIGDASKELLIQRKLLVVMERNAEQQRAKELGHLTKDMEVQRQQYLNDQLSLENKLKTEEIRRRKRLQNLMIGILALGFLALLASSVALRRGRQIKKQRASLKLILDSIEEGILRFGADFSIKGEYSRHTSDLLGTNQDLRGQNLWQLLFERAEAGVEDRQIWKETLSAIFNETALAWDLNAAHLPTQLRVDQRILALHWQALPDSAGFTQMILLQIRDITRSIEMQNEAREAQDRITKVADRVEAIARGRPQRVGQFLLEAEKILAPLHQAINEKSRTEVKRTLHTLKGMARSLGLKDISTAVHEIEDLILDKNLGSEIISEHCRELQNILAAYRELLPHLSLVQEEQSLDNLWDIASHLFPEAHQRLEAGLSIPPTFLLKNDFNAWDRVDKKAIRDMLLHAITNSIDHGFLLPKARGKEFDRPILAIETQWFQGNLEILVRDNGSGINWPRLHAMAVERGFQPTPGRQLTDLLFMDGASTAEKVSTTAGRGVGLSAILDLARKHGGDAALLDNDQGRGTVLRLLVPVPTPSAASA